MFNKLMQRWKVSGINLLFVICTFALGGSLCGWVGRKLLLLAGLEKGFLWVILYIVVVTLLWPFCVLLVSIPLGQFSFFKNYLLKIRNRLAGKHVKSMSIAIFASGAGTNAEKIIREFNGPAGSNAASDNYGLEARVTLIVCNKTGAGVLRIAEENGIETLIIEKERFNNGDHYLPELKQHKIDFIVLAGFLWKVPPALIKEYPEKIVNIHPALLPKYGGKGMYGQKVHESVIAAGDLQSGITIHFVDEIYDHGKVILQANCEVNAKDNAETLAQKIHSLEHLHYPATIRKLLNAK